MSDVTLSIPLNKLADLAAEHWRLVSALQPGLSAGNAAPIRHALRKIGDFLQSCELEARALDGQPYDAGLAARIIDTVDDPSLAAGVVAITETLAPLILYKNQVIRPADIVISRNAR